MVFEDCSFLLELRIFPETVFRQGKTEGGGRDGGLGLLRQRDVSLVRSHRSQDGGEEVI